jgi:hypothetical protein
MFYDKRSKTLIFCFGGILWYVIFPLFLLQIGLIIAAGGGISVTDPDSFYHAGYMLNEPGVLDYIVKTILISLLLIGVFLLTTGLVYLLEVVTTSSFFEIQENDDYFFNEWLEKKYPEVYKAILLKSVNSTMAETVGRILNVKSDAYIGTGHWILRREMKKSKDKIDFLFRL